MCSFFFNDTATTEIYTLSLHDALPIFRGRSGARGAGEADEQQRGQDGDEHGPQAGWQLQGSPSDGHRTHVIDTGRSEEHTPELQSRQYLVCRLLLEKKNSSV